MNNRGVAWEKRSDPKPALKAITVPITLAPLYSKLLLLQIIIIIKK
jgi:hypothetical protein